MNTICNDNNLSYFLFNNRNLVNQIGIVLLGLTLLLRIVVFLRKRKNKKIKPFVIGYIVLGIFFSISIGLSIFSSKIQKEYEICLEEEELKAILAKDVLPSEIVEKDPRDSLKEEDMDLEEGIEITEENSDEEDLEAPGNMIYFLNVGAGTESFILQDQGHFGLIDTSYNSKADFIVKQLKALGAEELDFLVITHAHLDHMGGYSKIMSSIPVKTLYIKNPGNVNSNYVPTYLSMIKEAEEKGTTICDVKEELCQSMELGYMHLDLYNTEFVNAKGVDGLDRSRVENANSMTLVATINHKKVYFASDIGDYFDKKQETKTAKEVGDIDVYKAAHHGYISYNNSLEALSILKPEYVIMTNTKELSKVSLNRIKNTSPDYQKTYYTTNGTITLHINMDGTMEFNQ